ncbi:hypothetical protein KIPB_013396 [Kipferlia bialata]|uniref:Uncharacterized protein n=1 Tax=Kipferlia bialata TaxID=797122 RepID=A0A9K3DAV1_9EUKA|nr:hypothetical protein KIPB_013396 [Kipferlia bialata]|eukprot:g13396.t1
MNRAPSPGSFEFWALASLDGSLDTEASEALRKVVQSRLGDQKAVCSSGVISGHGSHSIEEPTVSCIDPQMRVCSPMTLGLGGISSVSSTHLSNDMDEADTAKAPASGQDPHPHSSYTSCHSSDHASPVSQRGERERERERERQSTSPHSSRSGRGEGGRVSTQTIGTEGTVSGAESNVDGEVGG